MSLRPPTMQQLLENEYFSAMMRRNIKLPANLLVPTLSPPFLLWRLNAENKWQRGHYHSYAEAYAAMKRQLAKPDTTDVSIVSKRKMFQPPIGFKWNTRKYEWCARCRRPSTFVTRYRHHALIGVEKTTEDIQRCYYCGIRRIALPRYKPR